jgi:hypothetical protein
MTPPVDTSPTELMQAIRADVVGQGDVPLAHAVEWANGDLLAKMWAALPTPLRLEMLVDLRVLA